jgi:DNA-binding CsgD family transcriptional regulator
MEVIGRHAELLAIGAWIGSGGAGPQGSLSGTTALVVEGEPGIGKTTVWEEAIRLARADGRRVLSCRPRRSDAALSHVALTDLLRSVPADAFRALPAPQRRSIEVATLRREAGIAELDPRAVGTALTALLADLSDAGPVLVAVDDGQWLDPPSANALAFALHRLDNRDVRLLMAVRIESLPETRFRALAAFEATLGRARVQRLTVGPLTVGAIHGVFVQVLGKSVTRPTLVRIHQASGGNPFYALEIACEIQGLGLSPGQPLPVPQDRRELALLRLRRLPRATRDTLARVAAMSRPSTKDVDLVALAPAERAGIVRVFTGGRVDFTHPLFGSALYASLPESAKRELHSELAATEADLEERARHLALAATGPDGVGADVLDRAADVAGSRGAPGAAVELKELALRLTPPEDTQNVARRKLELASRRYFAGDTPGARQELEGALLELPPGEARAQVLLELGSVRWNQGDAEACSTLLRQALHEADAPALKARIHTRISSMTDDFEVAAEHAEAALGLTDEHEDPLVYSFALHNLARAKFYAGRGADHEAMEKGMLLQREEAGWEISTAPAFWARDFDDFDTAIRRFEEMLRVFGERGDEASCSGVLAQMASIHAMTGRLDVARHRAAEALELAHQTEQETWVHVALTVQAQVSVRAGELGPARATAEEVLRQLKLQPDPAIECMVRAVLGMVALSAGQSAEAVRQFSCVDAFLGSVHNREPAADRVHADYAEALIDVGDLDRAEEVVLRMEARARALPRPWILAVSARSRGLMLSARGDLDGAAAAMLQAVERHVGLDMPLEHGRTLLALGQVLRRRKERRAARAAFEEALATFESLGTQPWVERARDELARVPVRRAPAFLTPTEERIARLAASGMTNKEIATRAFVTDKTVEANLARAYGKLGVHSRAELGRVMFERDTVVKK